MFIFSDFQCSVREFEINKSKPDWHNYVLCGVKGMTEFLALTNPVGMQCMVDGCVPNSAGLSSSSALVCCAALAMMQANNGSRSKVGMRKTSNVYEILILFPPMLCSSLMS